MTGAGSVSLRQIGRVKSAATRVALLPVVDLAGYTANTAFWLARTAANLEVAAARARLHPALRPPAAAGRLRRRVAASDRARWDTAPRQPLWPRIWLATPGRTRPIMTNP